MVERVGFSFVKKRVKAELGNVAAPMVRFTGRTRSREARRALSKDKKRRKRRERGKASCEAFERQSWGGGRNLSNESEQRGKRVEAIFSLSRPVSVCVCGEFAMLLETHTDASTLSGKAVRCNSR